MENNSSQRDNEILSKLRRLRAWMLLLVIIYAILLTPYVAHSNLVDGGVVLYSEKLPLQSLPNWLQDLLRTNGISDPNLIILYHRGPAEYTTSGTPATWTMAIISEERFPVGSVAEVKRYFASYASDWHNYPYLGQKFDQFSVAEMKKVAPVETWIETHFIYAVSSSGGHVPRMSSLYSLSQLDFYGGPIVLFILFYIIYRKLALWYLPGFISCYTFAFFLNTFLANAHNNYIDPYTAFFGLSFVVWMPLTIIVMWFERTPFGQKITKKILER